MVPRSKMRDVTNYLNAKEAYLIMDDTRRGSALSWAMLFAFTLVAMPTSSAQSVAQDDLALEEVVVTARKSTESLIDVPLAITAFTADAIESRGISNLDDVASFTPGLTFSNVLGDFLPAPVIRGVAPIDIFGELNTAVFFDGVFVSGREGINFNQLDLERIEVVKGPQAALYGRNAFSGAINYVSAKPGDVFKSRATLTAGNRGKRLASLMLSGPIFGDLKGRATFLHDEWDGSYENQYSGPGRRATIGGYEFSTFNGSLLWDVSDQFAAELGLYISSDDVDNTATTGLVMNCEDRRVRDQNLGLSGNIAGTTYPRSSRLLNYCGELPSITRDSLTTMPDATGEKRHLIRSYLKLSRDMAGGALEAITGYSRVKQGYLVDGSRNTGNTVWFTYQPAPVSPFPLGPGVFGTRSGPLKRFQTGLLQVGGVDNTSDKSQEIRFVSDRKKSVRYSLGVYYYETSSGSGLDGAIATTPLPADFGSFCLACTSFGPTTIVDFVRDGGNAVFLPWFRDPSGGAGFDAVIIEEASAPSVFGSFEYDLTDRFTASVEGRYTDEKRSFVDKSTRASRESDWGLNSWRGTLRYKPAERVTLFASVAHSEKSGDFDPTRVRFVDNAAVEVTVPTPFDPETLKSIELGMKAEFFDRRLGVELDVYQLDWSDIVIPQVISKIDGREIVSATGVNVNAGDATVKGVELAILARPFSGLELNVGASFADPTYDRAQVETFGDFPSFAPTGDISGNQILRTSKIQANAGLQYSMNIGNGDEMVFRTDVSHRGKQFADASNQTIVPASTFVNASLGLRSEEWSVEVWGRNLTDEDAPTGAFRDAVLSNTLPNGNYSTGTFLPFRYSVSHPRRTTYGVTLRYNF